MTIQVQGVTVINTGRQLSNITNLKTVGGQSILGTGDISANGSRAIVDYVFSGNPASGSGGDEIWNFTFSPDYVVTDTTTGFSASSATLPSNRYWRSMDYGDGTWVAVVPNTSTYAYSSDGVVWTEGTLPMSASWYKVSYAGGRWFVFAGGAAGSVTSSSWYVTSTDATGGWQQFLFANSGIANTNQNLVWTNVIYDGVTWFVGGNENSNLPMGYGFIYSSSTGTGVWTSSGLTLDILHETTAMFYDPIYDYYICLRGYVPNTSGQTLKYVYKSGSGAWSARIATTPIGGIYTKFVKVGQYIFYTTFFPFSSLWLIFRAPITSEGNFPSSADLNLSSSLFTGGEQVTDFKYLDNKFVILTNSNKLFYCISSDGVTPSVLTAANWVMVQLTTSTNWTSIVYGAADQKSVAISGTTGGVNFAQIFTGSPIETRYNLALPNHGTYTSVINLIVRPPIGVTPTQQANLLGSTILANRPGYTITYPSAGQVRVDTNSGGNIGDVILTMESPPVSGSLNLVIEPGGGTAQQDVITVTDPGNGQTYIYTGDLYATVANISNSVAYNNTLSNWQMMSPISISNASKLTLLAVNNGYVTTATMPTIVITTGTNSTLAVTRFIRSFGN